MWNSYDCSENPYIEFGFLAVLDDNADTVTRGEISATCAAVTNPPINIEMLAKYCEDEDSILMVK